MILLTNYYKEIKMASLNKCSFIGNLTKDPEGRAMANGDAVTNISIACNEQWKDKNGDKQEKVEFINVTFYRKLAEIAAEYLKKGQQVYIEGKMETRKYTDKQGVERYATGIIANELVMLGSKSAEPRQADSERTKTTPRSGAGFDDLDNNFTPF
jgi:single-strand DNA-binding protein